VARALDPASAAKPLSGFAFVSLTRGDAADFAAGALALAAKASGHSARARVVSGPRDEDLTAHVLALSENPPQWSMFMDDTAAITIPGARIIRWHAGKTGPREADRHLAATSERLGELNRSNMEAHLWPWAAADAPEPGTKISQPAVVLVADWVDRSAESCGVEQPTHRQLWQAAEQVVERGWRGEGVWGAEAVLARCERQCGLSLTDQKLRGWMTDLIADRMIPSLVGERVAEALAESGPVGIVGRSWPAALPPGASPIAETIFDVRPAEKNYAIRVCVLHRAAHAPHLIQCSAAGIPVAAFALSPSLRKAVEPVLSVAAALQFRNAAELRTVITRAQRDPQVRSAAKESSSRLLREHSYAARFEQLCGWLATIVESK
jgi:hypothetical protein